MILSSYVLMRCMRALIISVLGPRPYQYGNPRAITKLTQHHMHLDFCEYSASMARASPAMISEGTETPAMATLGHEEEERLLDDETPQSPASAYPSPPSSLTAQIVYFMSIHFLLAFCEMILVAPLIRLFEESLCLSHFGFPSVGVPEISCKIPEIQQPLATIRGWKSMFDTIPGRSSSSIIGICV